MQNTNGHCSYTGYANNPLISVSVPAEIVTKRLNGKVNLK